MICDVTGAEAACVCVVWLKLMVEVVNERGSVDAMASLGRATSGLLTCAREILPSVRENIIALWY